MSHYDCTHCGEHLGISRDLCPVCKERDAASSSAHNEETEAMVIYIPETQPVEVDVEPKETISVYARLQAVINCIHYPGLQFELVREGGVMTTQWFVRVVCDDGTCNVTGEDMSWKGRKWRLSEHMTDGEIVQTAFLALLTAQEHEARENFTFMDQPVLDGHYDIYQLVKLHEDGEAIAEREDAR